MLHSGALSIVQVYAGGRNEARSGHSGLRNRAGPASHSLRCLSLAAGGCTREEGGRDRATGEFMCPHLPFLGRLQGFADCVHGKPPDVDHQHSVCSLCSLALPPVLTWQDSIQPRLHLAFQAGNDSAQTESAYPSCPEVRSSTLSLQIERRGSLMWAPSTGFWDTRHRSVDPSSSQQPHTDCPFCRLTAHLTLVSSRSRESCGM